MDIQEKKVFQAYLSNRKKLKSHIEELLSRLEHSKEEKECFIQFASEHQEKEDLLASTATTMIMDIMEALDFPNQWKNFTDLIFLHLEELGYNIDEDDKHYGDQWHDLVDDCNGYWSIARHHGDLFVIDCNIKNQSIKIADHSCHITRTQHVDEIYSEHFDLWFKEETNSYVNKNNLLLHKVFDKDGNFDLEAEYIKEFLSEELEDTGVNYYAFVNYIISKSEQVYLKLFRN